MTALVRVFCVWVLTTMLCAAAPPAEFVPEAQPSNETSATTRPPLPPAPPAPTIQLLLLAPADSTPGKELAYTIQLSNPTSADALKVVVRMPLPEGTSFVSSDPPANATPTGITWDLKTLNRNETRRLEIKLKPNGTASEISARAYVSYEFGQAVKTRISSPKLKVTTEVPKQAINDQPIPVKVKVVNSGRTPIENAKLVETISDGFDYAREAPGESTKERNQRTFDLGTIPPGMGKTIDFNVTAKQARDLTVTSVVTAAGLTDSHSADVKVGEVKLKVDFRGDARPGSDETATYKATVRNEGTMPLTNVRVVGSVPGDCQVVSRTNGGQIGREQVVWILPKMAAGEERNLKWSLRTNTAGRKTVRLEATADRGLADGSEVATVFPGTPALSWEQKFDTPTVMLDRQGVFTIKVTNTGSEVANDVRLNVTLPSEVSFVQATPTQTRETAKITFESKSIKPGSTEVYTMTFRGESKGMARFVASLSAECLGSNPLSAEKSVAITSVR